MNNAITWESISAYEGDQIAELSACEIADVDGAFWGPILKGIAGILGAGGAAFGAGFLGQAGATLFDSIWGN